MSFADRLRECAYVSPSGKIFAPLFDELERGLTKKVSVHEAPGRDVADVQEHGNEAQRWPMALYFRGTDYDMEADRFFDALAEHGRGMLQHPRWGDHQVMPTKIAQTEKYVDEMWLARFQVEFVEAPDPAALTVSTTTTSAIQSAAGAAGEATSEALGADAAALNATQAAAAKAQTQGVVASVMERLRKLTTDAADVRARMLTEQSRIAREIDTLFETPVALLQVVTDIVRMPATAAGTARNMVNTYLELIIDQAATLASLSVGAVLSVITAIAAALMGASESSATGSLASREDAIDVYDSLGEASDAALEAIEGHITDPDTLAALRQTASDARARLLAELYSLPTERRMVLSEDSTPIQLAHQFYGDPEQYQQVIDENGLEDELIFTVPAGTEVRWYA